MHNIIDLIHRLFQTSLVAHIPNEVSHTRRIEHLLHLKLLELIARKYDNFLRREALEYNFYELLAERSCSTGNQTAFIVEQNESSPIVITMT